MSPASNSLSSVVHPDDIFCSTLLLELPIPTFSLGLLCCVALRRGSDE